MEFLVEFEINVPGGTAEIEVDQREQAEAAAAGALVEQGHLLRVWRLTAPAERRVLGLYRADSGAQLHELLEALPLYDWMRITVTALDPHPNDPGALPVTSFGRGWPATDVELPDPRLTPVYRLEAVVGPPLDLGETARGHRRIVPLTGGTFAGPELRGTLVAGMSADWQTILPDGTALGDIRYTLQTDEGHLLSVRSRGVRHGSDAVLGRLARGENVDASEYTFRTSTQIETAAPELDWMNKGVFIAVGGRQPGAVIYETYLVG
jgi:muconolactone delta-isomerase